MFLKNALISRPLNLNPVVHSPEAILPCSHRQQIMIVETRMFAISQNRLVFTTFHKTVTLAITIVKGL